MDRAVDRVVDWRDGGFIQRRPNPETLAWVEASMRQGSRVVGYRRLTGGVSSAVHRVTVEQHGIHTFVVLRQYQGGMGLENTLKREISNLELVAGSGLPVPTVLASDVAGASTGGTPSLLMTQLPGQVELDPADRWAWLTRIAELAASVHALDLPAKTLNPWADSWIAPLDALQVPSGARRPDVWKAAFAAMETPPPPATPVFLHGDFLPVNLLWCQGNITGLTDWNGIHRGSRAVDIGHCRRYLAALHTPEWAEHLRTLYESITGVTLDPWWDLFALLHHDDNQAKWITRQVSGRRRVDAEGMTPRVEYAIEATLQRV